MKVTTVLRTSAQLKGMFDEIRAKRQIIRQKMKTGQLKEKDVENLKNDLDKVAFGFEMVEELVCC